MSAVEDACGNCTKEAIDLIIGQGVNKVAASASAAYLSASLRSSLTSTVNDLLSTLYVTTLVTAMYVFVPVVLLLLIIVWLMVPAGVLTTIAATMLTVIISILAAILLISLRYSLSAYLSINGKAISAQLINYFEGQDYLTAVEASACVYVSTATPPPAALVDTVKYLNLLGIDLSSLKPW